MTRPVCLQVYISHELSALIRKAAKAKGISMSEWVRALLANTCAGDEVAFGLDASIERISRQSLFVMVGIDALLAGHSDHALRERAHQAYARKCRELGLVASTDEGAEA